MTPNRMHVIGESVVKEEGAKRVAARRSSSLRSYPHAQSIGRQSAVTSARSLIWRTPLWTHPIVLYRTKLIMKMIDKILFFPKKITELNSQWNQTNIDSIFLFASFIELWSLLIVIFFLNYLVLSEA